MSKSNVKEKRSKDNENIDALSRRYDQYIGIDWSAKNMAIGRLTSEATEPVVIDVPSDITGLKLYLKNLQGRKIITVEETTSSQWLYVELHDYAEEIIICDPYQNRLLSDGAKNDKTDARKLCLLLRNGLLKEVFHTTDRLYELRKLVSSYDDLVKSGVRLLNQKSALYRAENKSHKRKEALKKNATKEFIVSQIDEGIQVYLEIKSRYEEKFSEIASKNKTIKNLMTLPGLGVISAVTIMARVIDAKRFKNTNHYLSYCGLVKHQKQSGGRNYGKRIGRYSRQLKSIYKSAAIRVIAHESPIKEYYKYLINERHMEERNARQSVARYIARLSLGIMKTGKKYNPYQWREAKKEKEAA